jgi:DNA-binding response OmpR family regulator
MVLIVEHDAMIRAHMERLVEIAGQNWMCVGSATEARAAMRMLFFPVLIIQRTLQDGDGIDLCNEIRGYEQNRRSYIALLAASERPDDVAKGLAAGADDYISTSSADHEIVEQLRRASHHAGLPNKLAW